MWVITNADDLGISSEVNQATFELMTEGLVTSATIIANAPAVADACGNVGRFPSRSFGVHLNLTQFAPIGSSSLLRPLMSADGEFDGRIRQMAHLGRLRRGVFEEWCAQIESVAARGVSVTHLDSHHHVHTIPALFPVLKAVQRKYGIRRVRISRNVYGQSRPVPRRLALEKRAYNLALRHWYATQTTGAFTDLEVFLQAREELVRRYLNVELELHPGAVFAGDETLKLRALGQADPAFRGSLINFSDL